MIKMKKLFTLLFSILISFNAYGEWSLVVTSTGGVEYHVDLDRISKKNGYIYYWALRNYPKPRFVTAASTKVLYEVDCTTPSKERRLAYYSYRSAMGNGPVNIEQIKTLDWEYAPPGSIRDIIFEEVC